MHPNPNMTILCLSFSMLVALGPHFRHLPFLLDSTTSTLHAYPGIITHTRCHNNTDHRFVDYQYLFSTNTTDNMKTNIDFCRRSGRQLKSKDQTGGSAGLKGETAGFFNVFCNKTLPSTSYVLLYFDTETAPRIYLSHHASCRDTALRKNFCSLTLAEVYQPPGQHACSNSSGLALSL